MQKLNLIGLHGMAGSGKDFAASVIGESFEDVNVLSFASPLYRISAALLGVSVDFLAYRPHKEVKRTFYITQDNLDKVRVVWEEEGMDAFGELPYSLGVFLLEVLSQYESPIGCYNGAVLCVFLSPRKILELVGTEWVRNLIGKDTWLNVAQNKLKADKLNVITDVRFPNEGEFIKNTGGAVWNIVTDNKEFSSTSTHPSALPLPQHLIDETLFNDFTETFSDLVISHTLMELEHND